MITAPTLTEMTSIRHGFFTRQGGLSDGIYASLNCGPGSNDNPDHVRGNRTRAAAALGVDAGALVTAHQVHSADAIGVDTPWALGGAPKLDGMATNTPGIALGVLHADCAPVLFADPDAGVIGAAHAGWKGALGGVTDATVEKMTALGARPSDIRAVIGPCIGQASYEVGAEFRTAFLEAATSNELFFAPGAGAGKFQFDLGGYLQFRLQGLGLGSVELLGLDTYADPERFFSYRRATHRGEPDYGRMLSAIVLTG